jgi:hypothetical protein
LFRALQDGTDIAWLGNVRKVELRLQVIAVARSAAMPFSPASLRLLEVRAHTLSFIHLDGAGVRLLLGDADLGKYVKDRLALYLKFSG